MKQLGTVWGRQNGADSKGGDWTYWPDDLRIREYPAETSSCQPDRANSPMARPKATSRLYSAADVLGVAMDYYARGRHDADVCELIATWAERDVPRATRAGRIAGRVAEMRQAAERVAEREGRVYREYLGGPVDWETGTRLEDVDADEL